MRHFRNPALVIAMRLGLLRIPFFPYRIKTRYAEITMLARPGTVSMGDLFVLRELFIDETYRDLLALIGGEPVRIVDVGANLGSFVVWLHRRHGVREAFCFEPEPTSFQLCRFNLFGNGCDFAKVVQSAVGGRSRRISLQTADGRPGAVSIYKAPSDNGRTAEVEVIAMNRWLQEVSGEFDILKLDCEGAEWEILDETPPKEIRRFRIIVAEVHGDSSGKHPVEDFPRLLEERGFRTIRWDNRAQGVYLGVRDKSTNT
jgi:FkbM family methyltransferase